MKYFFPQNGTQKTDRECMCKRQGNIWKSAYLALSVKYFHAFLKPKNRNYKKKHFCKIFDRVAGGYQFWYNYHPSLVPGPIPPPLLSCLVHFESFTVSVKYSGSNSVQQFKVPRRIITNPWESDIFTVTKLLKLEFSNKTAK